MNYQANNPESLSETPERLSDMVVYLFHYSTIKCIQINAHICNFCNILQHLFHSNIVEALANTTLLAI